MSPPPDGQREEDRRFQTIFDSVQPQVRDGEHLPDNWVALLNRRDDGGWHPTINNAAIIMHWDKTLRGLVAYNQLLATVMLRRAPPTLPSLPNTPSPALPGPYPRPLDDIDHAAITAYFERTWSPKFKMETVKTAIAHEAWLNQYHPIRDWLRTLHWDGVARIDGWLNIAFGCPDDLYHRAVGSKFLIAAVRRVMQPGCKFDSMMVVEGEQDLGKSTALRRLFGDTWFTDDMHPKLDGAEAARSIQGYWCIEMAEIEQILRHEAETVKAFLSRQTDRVRPLYINLYKEMPRQGVFVGSTNAKEWLRDSTGNRRFWPVSATHARFKWIEEFRDQLWAEAVQREMRGPDDPLGSIHLDDALQRQAAKEQQAERLEQDIWTDRVRAYCSGRPHVQISELVSSPDGLNMPTDRQNRATQMRVGKILDGMGWTSRRRRIGSAKTPTRCHVPPEGVEHRPEPADPPETPWS